MLSSLLLVFLLATPGRASSSHSWRRELLQAQFQSAKNRELPRLNIGKVKATQVNTYSWSIQRQSSASGVAVTADGYSRTQMGYQLTFTRTLQKSLFRIDGVAAITNPSGQGYATLQSVNILAGGRELQVPCLGMPAAPFQLQPFDVIECPFTLSWDSNPGADSVSGYVQTAFGRAAAATAPLAYDFSACGSSSSSSSGDGSAAEVTAVACTVQEQGACVSVTDGSYIVNKYKDKLGQELAGAVTRSRLFETSTVQDSTLGPPRIEPPTPPTPVSTASVPDTPPVWTPKMPDSTWWNGRRRALLWSRAADTDSSHLGISISSSSGRQLLQKQQQSSKDALVASFDASFLWPYPTVTGDRPPVGLSGKPERGAARQICDSRTFSYGMVWGPLLPAACGTFEVQNFAAALPTDASFQAVSSNTFMILQVLCPAAAVQERASTADRAEAAEGASRSRRAQAKQDGG